jgi:tRNA (uracil-5-)-methyltransferase TRM9
MMVVANVDRRAMRKEFADALVEKVRRDYDSIADSFSDSRYKPWPEMLAFPEHVPPGGSVLDMGCGNGRAYQVFEGRAITYEGIDSSERLVAHARRLVRSNLARFRVGDLRALPYADTSFDLAIAVASIHHLPSREYRRAAIAEAFRVLKPGGTFIMESWNLWRPKFAREILGMLRNVALRKGYDWGDMLEPWKAGSVQVERYYHAYTAPEAAADCRAAGFEVVENGYKEKGKPAPRWRGEILVTVCRKPAGDPLHESSGGSSLE